MHPRNPYKHHPDFRSLAEFFPSLKPYLSISPAGNHSLDFRDPNAQRALTQALLKRDFDITLSLPPHRLCPPVPNRLNYVLWIQDILFPYNEVVADREIKGLDVGTGASAIYPLLACSLPNTGKWTFVGTEIDLLSADFALRNVEANNLQSRITICPIHKTQQADLTITEEDARPTPILTPLTEDSESRFDFAMCNPPFYGSTSEIESSAEAKDLPPIAICTGAETEMITPGGETAFVLQMVQESAREDVRGRCRWFTSMLGKLASVGEVVRELRRRSIDNYALTQFVQGTTRRWAVAWSFEDERLPDTVARSSSSSLSSYLPAPTALRQSFTILHRRSDSPPSDMVRLKSALSDVLHDISGVAFHPLRTDTQSSADADPWKLDVTAGENTWSRAARRRTRKRKRSISPSASGAKKTPPHVINRNPPHTTLLLLDATPPAPDLSCCPALQCWISVLDPPPSKYSAHTRDDSGSLTLEAQWTRGKDRGMFEGFWSHVCRKVTDELGRPAAGESGAQPA